jgi:hypothetical protein
MPRLDLIPVFRNGIAVGLILVAAGCSSLKHYLVDAKGAAVIHLEPAAVNNDQRESHDVRFDAAGGRVDPDSWRIIGRDTEGARIALPISWVRNVTFKLVADDAGRAITARMGPLPVHSIWAPRGRLLSVVQSDSTVIDLRRLPSRVDVDTRFVFWSPAPGEEKKIPFSNIAYLQMKQESGGRTALLVTGQLFIAGFIALGIALESTSITSGG